MKIKKIHIKNYKSLVDFELENLKAFCAFVGPNASGKSNIFEALEFMIYVVKYSVEAPLFFRGKNSILSYNNKPLDNSYTSKNFIFSDVEFQDRIRINFIGTFTQNDEEKFPNFTSVGNYWIENDPPQKPQLPIFEIRDYNKRKEFISNWTNNNETYENDFENFIDNFSRIFIGNPKLIRINESPPALNLLPDASNLSQIIGKVFENDEVRNDFIEWLGILIPEFRNIEIQKSNIDGSFEFFLYEKSSKKPFPKYLISDGTYNILSLMAAVYQTDQPQFLCIEEPENGLHPQAIELLVDFFREQCEEKGHYIWLNTHSPTLVRCLEFDEIILVNKINGETKAKQLTKEDEINIKTDEAWLSNALGGGVS